MAFITLPEIFDMAFMTLAVGYIFSGTFRHPHKQSEEYDPIATYKNIRMGVDWQDMKFAMLVTAPAIIVHEFGHKLVAMAFGLQATFNAAYSWLLFGAFLKLIGSAFLFFVPAYVSITGGNELTYTLTALAGPAVNLILWLGSALLLKQNRVKGKWMHAAILTSKINMFLFIFNMLPIPGFDGLKVYQGLWAMFAG